MTEHIRSALALVAAGRTLGADLAEAFMASVLDGEVTPAQLAGCSSGCAMRGETAEELTGFVRAMRARVRRCRGAARHDRHLRHRR